ncbi:MAG: ribosomal protein S18-alanine N-acetyltransferase [Coleofasciculaceae cyanobacterium]
MSNLEIKPLTTEQLSAALELDRLCFGGLWTLSGYERELASPNSQLLVLEPCQDKYFSYSLPKTWAEKPNRGFLDQEPISPSSFLLGLGCYWSILEEAHITIIAVHPNYRRQGLGQLLLYSLLEDARNRKLEMATLEVKPSNQAALSLYQKFGFTTAGRRRRYYQDTGEDALILWRSGLQSQEFEEILANYSHLLLSQLNFWGWQLATKLGA